MNSLLLNGTVAALTALFGPTLYEIILNGFGVLAICCKVSEYQAKKRSIMFIFATLANFLWVLYFAFYGDWASALTCFIATVRMLVFMQSGKHKWADGYFWLIFFIIVQAVVSVSTFTGWQDVAALVAGFVGIVTYYVKNEKWYRILSVVFMALWICNGLIKFYPIALISDSFSIISATVAIFRFDILAKKASVKTNNVDKTNKE